MGAASDGRGEEGSAAQSSSSSLSGAFVPPKIGAALGRYEIQAPLGHGAMATVFRARDTQLGRDVAIKVMGMVHAARGGASERFRREAHAVAALKHAGIVEIYDFVEATIDSPSYIVAELIRGPTLRKLLEQRGGRLLPEVAALIALPLSEALAVAHERGVIHRDVKPDNVMIEVSGEGSRVVLTDFGVAHITGMETMTATGALVGSPAYMSPEQSRGHDVGPTADVWSLGAMLYEMVTGVVPFAGKDPYTMIAAILRGNFRRPSQVVATVGTDFEPMIMRCLKASAAERYPSAADLARDLRAFVTASGLSPDGTSLRRFLDDPQTAETEIRPRVADAAVQRARQYARRGQIARALSELGHATAYVPSHPGADRLLRRLSASRRLIKTAGALVMLAVVGTTLWGAQRLMSRQAARPAAPETTSPVNGLSHTPNKTTTPPMRPSTPTRRPPTRGATVAAPAQHGHAAPPPAPRPTAVASAKTSSRGRGRRPRSDHEVAPEPTAASAADNDTTLEPAPAEEPAPTPPKPVQTKPVVEPRTGTVALFAKGGFCFPTLDDHPVRDLMPVFRDLPVGKHKVFCARTKSSPKELVGEIDLPPGARIERTVTEIGGRLTIARPR